MLALLLATPIPAVGTYLGGTGAGQDHEITLRPDGTGTYGLQGCFDEDRSRITWSVNGDALRIGVRPQRTSTPHRQNDFISPSNAYLLRRIAPGTFLVPVESLRSFEKAARRGWIVRAHLGRWPYLHRQDAMPMTDPDRPLILRP